jgi:uncharacterized membrane protein YbhN (UPF0104 family)
VSRELDAMIPLAVDLDQSLDRFLDAAERFFSNLAAIDWWPMAVALALYLAHLLARSRSWQNVLRAAYPDRKIPYARVAAAYLAGAGLNSFIPARVGDAVKIFLAKNSIRGSSYPAITSSFLVQTPFDTTVGILVTLYAITQGLLPPAPQLPDLPAFEIAFWAEHPRVLVLVITVLAIGLVILFAILARRAEQFWERVKQGVVVLTEPGRYLREVASWQGVGWLLRFGSFYFFLEAFGVGGSFSNVMTVLSVQAVTGVLPFTPGGIGPQQALLVASLKGPPAAVVLSYSVGQQVAIAVWTAILGFLALALVFRTTNWRAVISSAQEEAREREQRERAGPDADQGDSTSHRQGGSSAAGKS